MSHIETFTGRFVNPLDPLVDNIDIEDIAHALSHQCRFSGHTNQFYSVAEHSVRVSELVADWHHNYETQLWALLHDASEAYLVDVPTPLKSHPLFDFYSQAEYRLMRIICLRFGLPVSEPNVVREADAVLLATEARDLMPFREEHWGKLVSEPLEEEIVPWSSVSAKHNFLARYRQLAERL